MGGEALKCPEGRSDCCRTIDQHKGKPVSMGPTLVSAKRQGGGGGGGGGVAGILGGWV